MDLIQKYMNKDVEVELDEGKEVPQAFIEKLKDLTDSNYHIEARMEVAKFIKNKKLMKVYQGFKDIQDALGYNHSGSIQEVQNVFQRWDGSVVSSEFSIPEPIVDTDNFAKVFEQEEDELALKMMLDELTEQNSPSENNN